MMSGDITLEASRQCQRASKIMSTFIIIAVSQKVKKKKTQNCFALKM